MHPPSFLLPANEKILQVLEAAGSLIYVEIDRSGLIKSDLAPLMTFLGSGAPPSPPPNLFDWIHPNDHQHLNTLLDKPKEEQDPVVVNLRLQNKQIKPFNSVACSCLVLFTQKKGWRLFFLPKKESIEIDREDLLDHKMHLVSQLSAGVIHDLNNLFGSMQAFTQVLKDRLHQSEELRYILSLEKAILRAADLSGSILALLREEVEEMVPLDPIKHLQEFTPLIASTFSKDILFHVSFSSHHYPILLKSSSLTQILLNLVLNARDALDKKGKIEVVATYDSLEHPTQFLLTVQDNGKGIKKEDSHYIFDPFFTTKKKQQGMGLGLTIVKTIVEQAKGTIEVKSSIGQGTRFTIALPIYCTNTSSNSI